MEEVYETEQIEWMRVADKMPDAGVTVMIHTPASPSEPVYFGYFDDTYNEWNYDTGTPCLHAPTHWAEVPKGPAT